MYGEEQRVEPGDERTAAIETARSWELPYLEDEPIVIDSESAMRGGGEERARIGAAPVRCGDGNVRVVLADATPERIAGIREHFSGAVAIGVVQASTLASLLDAATVTVAAGPSDAVASGAAAAAPVWGRTLERVLGLFDTEATRLQGLRGKMQELGAGRTATEARAPLVELTAAPAAETEKRPLWRRKSQIIAELETELAATGAELEEHRQALANLATQLTREAEAARRNAEQLEGRIRELETERDGLHELVDRERERFEQTLDTPGG